MPVEEDLRNSVLLVCLFPQDLILLHSTIIDLVFKNVIFCAMWIFLYSFFKNKNHIIFIVEFFGTPLAFCALNKASVSLAPPTTP